MPPTALQLARVKRAKKLFLEKKKFLSLQQDRPLEIEQKSAHMEAVFVPSGEQVGSNEVKPASCVETDKGSRRFTRLASQNKSRWTIKPSRTEEKSSITVPRRRSVRLSSYIDKEVKPSPCQKTDTGSHVTQQSTIIVSQSSPRRMSPRSEKDDRVSLTAPSRYGSCHAHNKVRQLSSCLVDTSSQVCQSSTKTSSQCNSPQRQSQNQVSVQDGKRKGHKKKKQKRKNRKRSKTHLTPDESVIMGVKKKRKVSYSKASVKTDTDQSFTIKAELANECRNEMIQNMKEASLTQSEEYDKMAAKREIPDFGNQPDLIERQAEMNDMISFLRSLGLNRSIYCKSAVLSPGVFVDAVELETPVKQGVSIDKIKSDIKYTEQSQISKLGSIRIETNADNVSSSPTSVRLENLHSPHKTHTVESLIEESKIIVGCQMGINWNANETNSAMSDQAETNQGIIIRSSKIEPLCSRNNVDPTIVNRFNTNHTISPCGLKDLTGSVQRCIKSEVCQLENIIDSTKYESPEMSADPKESLISTIATKAPCARWQPVKSIQLEDAEKFVKIFEFGFRYKSENTPEKGTMRYYRCSRIKHRAKPQCERKVLLFIPNLWNDCTISARGHHTCNEAPAKNLAHRKLSSEHHLVIESLLKSGVPSKDIKSHLKATSDNMSNNQLDYAVKSTHRNIYGNGILSLGELEEWATLLSKFPTDNQKAFVIGKDIDHDGNKFRIVLSSLKMLSLLNCFDTISADCTYKTTLQGHPLLVVCVIDAMRHAHPVAFVCLSHQQQVDYEFVFNTIIEICNEINIRPYIRWFLSDGEVALKNAARSTFENCNIINCFFHVVQNVKKHLLKSDVPATEQANILHDINQLQVAPTSNHYILAADLFKLKYKHYPLFINFIEKYLHHDNFSGWEESFSPGIPSTNNALEAINKTLKYKFLHRKKEPFGTFKVKLLDIVASYSDPSRPIYYERTHELKHERKAFDYVATGLLYRSAKFGNEEFIFMASANGKHLTSLDITNFQDPKFSSFDQYASQKMAICRINVTDDNFRHWNASCYGFFKENVCEHILALAVEKKLLKLSPASDTTPMSSKKPTGRPKHSSKALVIDVQ